MASTEIGKSTELSVKSVSIKDSTDFQKGNSKDQRAINKRLSNTRRSSFFKKLSMSFRRSSGERGANVDTLRGTHGPDFEGYAMVSRGGASGGCGCFSSKSPKERLILIKGPFIFVFSSEEDFAPKYAISLAYMKPTIRGSSHGQTLVTLETGLGDVEYEFSFQEENIAKQFADAAEAQASVGETEQVKKRLGHEHLLKKRSSVSYAEKVALKKIQSQPEKHQGIREEELASISANPAIVGM